MASSAVSNNDDGDDGWCTIESDPGVFTSLVETLGVKNVEFTELWSLDDEALSQLICPLNHYGTVDGDAPAASSSSAAAVHGLIFLFKWQSNNNKKHVDITANSSSVGRVPLGEDEIPPGLYFARQMTHNACATQAILSVLFNATCQDKGDDSSNNINSDNQSSSTGADGHGLVLGKTLADFKSFTQHFPPDIRGEAIGSSDEIRTAHNSYGKSSDDAFLNDPSFPRPKRTAKDDDDVFHFVAYVPCQEDGCVYELDGLKSGPIRLGSYTIGDSATTDSPADDGTTTTTSMEWLRVARDAIQSRLADYPMGEIKFNLMAMVQDRHSYYTNLLESNLANTSCDGQIDVNESISSSPYLLSIRDAIHAEEEKRMQWKIEKERRQYNYLPFCVQLLRSLAGSGKFQQLVAEARKKHASSLEESRKGRRA
jgi:ubiquitin carboxyl-terminal hydrolase L5